MKVSVVIPVLNKIHFTAQCLEDLFKSTKLNLEVIVIDNASSDGTSDYLGKLNSIITITNNENNGCAASWNQGVRRSTGEWIIILNNDVRLPKDWIENLITFADQKCLDVVSPGMREGELNYNLSDYAANYMQKMAKALRYWTPSGVCFAVRKNVFEKIGLFDDYKIGQYEDADFFRRCKKSDLLMGISGVSFIHHFGSTTQKHIMKYNNNSYSKNNQLYHRKKWNIGFIQRHAERYSEKFLFNYWHYKEKLLFGHSLIEN
jgi:N-acetylglucosaminyl-diphospho-decaprenol L-rhamnosyltransferase